MSLDTRAVRLKVLYTVADTKDQVFLGRSPSAKHVPVYDDPNLGRLGSVSLADCVDLVLASSPEIGDAIKSRQHDYSVYLLDLTELDSPLVGFGHLSRLVDEAGMNGIRQDDESNGTEVSVIGKIARATPFFQHDTLEIQMRLVRLGSDSFKRPLSLSQVRSISASKVKRFRSMPASSPPPMGHYDSCEEDESRNTSGAITPKINHGLDSIDSRPDEGSDDDALEKDDLRSLPQDLENDQNSQDNVRDSLNQDPCQDQRRGQIQDQDQTGDQGRKDKKSMEICYVCGTTSTSAWRRFPHETPAACLRRKLVCNPCRLYFHRYGRLRPKPLWDSKTDILPTSDTLFMSDDLRREVDLMLESIQQEKGSKPHPPRRRRNVDQFRTRSIQEPARPEYGSTPGYTHVWTEPSREPYTPCEPFTEPPRSYTDAGDATDLVDQRKSQNADQRLPLRPVDGNVTRMASGRSVSQGKENRVIQDGTVNVQNLHKNQNQSHQPKLASGQSLHNSPLTHDTVPDMPDMPSMPDVPATPPPCSVSIRHPRMPSDLPIELQSEIEALFSTPKKTSVTSSEATPLGSTPASKWLSRIMSEGHLDDTLLQSYMASTPFKEFSLLPASPSPVKTYKATRASTDLHSSPPAPDRRRSS